MKVYAVEFDSEDLTIYKNKESAITDLEYSLKMDLKDKETIEKVIEEFREYGFAFCGDWSIAEYIVVEE